MNNPPFLLRAHTYIVPASTNCQKCKFYITGKYLSINIYNHLDFEVSAGGHDAPDQQPVSTSCLPQEFNSIFASPLKSL